MENIDVTYICTVIGNLSGIPVRLFEGEKLVLSYSVAELPKDPMCLHREEILSIKTSIGYFVTPHFNYYGIVNAKNCKIVIGPTRQVAQNPQELRTMAFRLDIPKDAVAAFVSGMQSIVRMPLESIMQILCVVNYILNGEMCSLKDITIYDTEQQELRRALAAQSIDEPPAADTQRVQKQAEVHNSLSAERAVVNIIQHGDTAALKQWIASAPAVRAGVMAGSQLRQCKNTFVVAATLASRAAIRGGMDVEDALSMSDAMIQNCELLSDVSRITNLQYHMILEYTRRVERIRHSAGNSPLAIQVTNYIHHNLSRPITVEAIAKHLYLSRPYLSARFKEETGICLTDFVLKEKTDEARRLLRDTDKSMAVIGDYLGFSSQSHFSRVFHKYAGCTPREYRDQYARQRGNRSGSGRD